MGKIENRKKQVGDVNTSNEYSNLSAICVSIFSINFCM